MDYTGEFNNLDAIKLNQYEEILLSLSPADCFFCCIACTDKNIYHDRKNDRSAEGQLPAGVKIFTR